MAAYELTPTCKVNLFQQLGRGASGTVYHGQLDKKDDDGKQNVIEVAVKRLEYAWKTDSSDSDKSDSISLTGKKDVNSKIKKLGLKEISILEQLGNRGNKHPNIVEFYGYKDDGNSIWIIMEYCNLGTLSDYMTKHKPDLQAKLRIMKECTEAIVYMHSLNLLHYDIKPSNILLKEENGKHVVKIADFAGSGIMGTKVFMAPELWKKRKDGLDRKSSDIFSLGLVFYVVLRYSQDHPHFVPVTNKMKENSFGEEMLNAAEKGLAQPELFDETHQPPDVITAKIQRDIVHMTQYRPHNRIDITDVLTHIKSYESEYRRKDGEKTRVERELDPSADPRSSDSQISDSAIDVPEACKAPYVELQGCTARLHWEPPHSDRSAPITGFIIEQQWLNSYGWLKTHEVDGKTFDCCIEGLMRGYKYQFCVTAFSKRGVGRRGLSSHVVETIGSPGQVENLQVFDITKKYCRLRWSRPHDGGDSSILEYIIEQNCGNSSSDLANKLKAINKKKLNAINQTNSWSESGRVSGSVLHYKVTSVEEGRGYKFRVIPKSGPPTYATSGMVLIKGESNDNKQMEKSCNSAISYVANIIAAIQNTQQSPNDLNLRVFTDKLKSITKNALLEVQVACDIVNKSLIDIDIRFKQQKVQEEEGKNKIISQNDKLAQTKKEYSVTEEQLRIHKQSAIHKIASWMGSNCEHDNTWKRKLSEYESQKISTNKAIESLETGIQMLAVKIKKIKKEFKDECDTLFLMNVFSNYVTNVAKTLETLHTKPFYDMHLIISPLQDLADFISSDEFHSCAVSLKIENGIKDLQSLVNESPLSRETQQMQKQERQLELLVEVRGTFLLWRLLQKQVLATWGHELELLLQDTSAGVIVKSGPGKDVIHKFKEHINKINLSDEETIKLNSRNVTSFDITLLSKLLKVPEISGIEVTQDRWNDAQSYVQYYIQKDLQRDLQRDSHEWMMRRMDLFSSIFGVEFVWWISFIIDFKNEIHNKTHMNLSKREIEKRVNYLSLNLTGLMNYVGISEEERRRHEHKELFFEDPHTVAHQQVRAAIKNLQLRSAWSVQMSEINSRDITCNSAKLDWKAAVGATSYDICVTGRAIINTEKTEYQLTGLIPYTKYTVEVTPKNDRVTGESKSITVSTLRSNVDYSLAADNKLNKEQSKYLWDEIGPSICQIIVPGCIATGFVVGSVQHPTTQQEHVFILTCNHVRIQDAIHPCYAEFGYTHHGQPPKFKVKIRQPNVACDVKLDYILVALEYEPQLLGFVKTKMANLIPKDHRPLNKEPLIIIGHPDGKVLQIDPAAYCVSRPNNTLQPDEYIFYQCNSFHGAAGAPVMSKDKRLLYAMHCGGSTGPASHVGRSSEVEHGVALLEVLKDIKQKANTGTKLYVAKTLFPQLYNDDEDDD